MASASSAPDARDERDVGHEAVHCSEHGGTKTTAGYITVMRLIGRRFPSRLSHFTDMPADTQAQA